MSKRRKTILDEFEEMERRIDDFFARARSSLEPMWDIQARTLKPLYDVRQTRESIKVLIDLPYVEKEAIQLRVDENSIDLSAKLRQPIKYDRWGTTQRECEFNKLYTTIPLPTEVDPDRAKAKLRDGILTVELPKKIKKKTLTVE
jgi:HSP20 family protein